MNASYLNPIDLFDLAGTPLEELTPSLLKKHKRRFIAELEIDDFDKFEVAGTSFVASDLERAVDELKEPGFLEAQHFAAKHPGITDFLTSGLFLVTLVKMLGPQSQPLDHYLSSRATKPSKSVLLSTPCPSRAITVRREGMTNTRWSWKPRIM